MCVLKEDRSVFVVGVANGVMEFLCVTEMKEVAGA